MAHWDIFQSRWLSKKRKNVIDPSTVRFFIISFDGPAFTIILNICRLLSGKRSKRRKRYGGASLRRLRLPLSGARYRRRSRPRWIDSASKAHLLYSILHLNFYCLTDFYNAGVLHMSLTSRSQKKHINEVLHPATLTAEYRIRVTDHESIITLRRPSLPFVSALEPQPP